MTTPGEERLRALRDALYRPGATEQDRRRYRDAVGEAAPEDAAPPATRRFRRRVLVILLAVATAVAVAVAARVLLVPAPPPYPTVDSAPIELLGDAAAQAGARADLDALFGEPDPFLGLYLARHRTALSASLRSDSIAVDGRGTGPSTTSLQDILVEGQATGLMTVLLACNRPGTPYSWVVEGPPDASGKPVRIGSSGPDCGGVIITATFVPRPHHVPTRIRITVPAGVRTIVEVDLSKY